ncbi:lipid carrier--UDP-N-acetylgalactosaminyltransferase [Sporanaerobium hydrogeniformans]|uniref:Lipid carrier--UDP-N-acetylgalactosaminyltransferase n=1 Tax=Sporanaerobium hydrogeniformans TaxID=3072179 RepID=A0AC61DBQ4_9FIRM|nr:sugar transferase [Sporanaerobium hydrogeniformans]PHV70148.1 lipid carrier--UDP-N-acetylgalactosaminyltransferase [Sporanaerobium hydrogeniformans]
MYMRWKRIADFIGAMLLIFITFPVMLMVALVIKLEDPKGPILFKQKRPGKNEVIFTIYKFRTMKIATHDTEGNPLSDMERMMKVGKIIRKLSLDELPQFFNVLKGEMSFIGPRPLLVQYLPYYSEEQRKRHHVRPGISGWAQVNGRNSLSWEEKFQLDIWYVEHMSLSLDVKIILKTLKNVFMSKDINNSQKHTMTYFGE